MIRPETAADRVRLRPIQVGDLPRMFDLQLDPDSNRMAVTITRTAEAFDSRIFTRKRYRPVAARGWSVSLA